MIRKRIHNKLVRDNIPDILRKKGIESFTHILNDVEYEQYLYRKLQEEVEEFLQTTDHEHWKEEMADIVEVIYALLKSKGVNFEQLETLRKNKKQKNGGFEKKIFLRETKERV